MEAAGARPGGDGGVAPRQERRQYTPMPFTALVLAPLAAAAIATTLVVAALHAPLRLAMRERGLREWRVRDTLLTSPLFVAGVALALLAANHGLVRLAVDTHAGAGGMGRAAASAVVVCGGLLMAAFGLRAVRKLF
jgi:hypothetical protein